MTGDDQEAPANGNTETSPLLGQGAVPDPGSSVNAIRSAPKGAPQEYGSIAPIADEEWQSNDHDGQDGAAQYEGLPEVKARMKYILPAIGIGVGISDSLLGYFVVDSSQIFLSAADQTIIVACYGKIGSDLDALNSVSWISTA